MTQDPRLTTHNTPPSARSHADLYQRIRRRRPLLTALFVLAALGLGLWGEQPPADLLDPRLEVRFVLPWLLMIAGVAVRIWGAGNLRKNQEITDTGIYQLVRHPLYLGSLLVFLAFFISVCNPWWGLALFAAMVLLVYYPTMLDEERHLAGRFPEHVRAYADRPRLLPSVSRLPDALRTDRFSFAVAYRNLGLRSVWVLIFLPLFLEVLARVERAI